MPAGERNERRAGGGESGSELASKASILILSKAVAAVSRIGAIALLARMLPKAEFGLLSFALVTYLAVSTLSQLGLPLSVYYFFGVVRPESRRSMVLLISRLLFYIALGTAPLLMLIALIAASRGYPVIGLFAPLAVLTLVEQPTLHIQNVFIALGKARQAAVVTVVFSAALFAAMIVPPILGMGIQAVSYALMAYGIFRLFVATIYFWRCLEPEDAALPEDMTRQVLSYSIPLGVAEVLWKVNQFIDKYVVMFLLPVVAFAEYSVGSWEIPLVPGIAISVAAVMMPQLVRRFIAREKAEFLALWSKSILKVTVIVLPLMVLLVSISTELIVVLFSSEYAGAGLVFAIYSLTLFQRVTDYGAVLKAINQTRAVTRWAGVTAVLNVALSVPFVLWLGMVGAAVSTLVATVLAWFYVLYVISRAMRISFARVFPFGFYIRVLAVAVAAAVPPVLAASLLELTPGAALAVKVGLYIPGYVVLSTVTGVCGSDDWRFLGSLVGCKRSA